MINTKITVLALTILASVTSCSTIPNNSNSSKSIHWKHNPKQGSVWSCHTFVATGLLEAEYHRATAKKIDLSEADLFLKHIKQGMPNWDVALSFYLARGVIMDKPRSLETGHVQDSYKLIQKHGIAMEDEIKYSSTGRIGIPLTMQFIRTSIYNIKKGIKEGKSQTELTVAEIDQIKSDGAFEVLSQESKYYASRAVIKQFASQYSLKILDFEHSKDKPATLKNSLNQRVVGLHFKVPSYGDPLFRNFQSHALIVTGFDEKKRIFTVRDSDSKGLFGNYRLTETFVKRYATKIYYLQKR